MTEWAMTDLPEPDSPTTQTISPLPTVKHRGGCPRPIRQHSCQEMRQHSCHHMIRQHSCHQTMRLHSCQEMRTNGCRHMILPRGTAYLSDAGMCGDYNSVIGMDKGEPLKRFVTGMGGGRFEPALGEATLAGVLVETDDKTGLATAVRPVRLGGRLDQSSA